MPRRIVLLFLALAPAAAAQPVPLRIFAWDGDPFAGTGRTPPVLPPGNVAPSLGSLLNAPAHGIVPVLPSIGGRIWLWATGSLGNPDPYVWNGISFTNQSVA